MSGFSWSGLASMASNKAGDNPVSIFSNGIAGALSSAVGNVINRRIQLKGAKELADYQFELNKRAWEMQNEYNLPVNQMARLEEAGLNPNLVYGNGSAANQAGSMASASTPIPSGGMTNPGEAAFRAMQNYAQRKVFEAEIAKARQDIERSKTITALQEKMQPFQIEKIMSERFLNDARRLGIDISNYVADRTKDTQVDAAKLNNQLLFANIMERLSSANKNDQQAALFMDQRNLVKAQTGMTYEQIDNVIADTIVKKETANKIFADTGLSYAQQQEVVHRTSNLIKQGHILSLDEEIKKIVKDMKGKENAAYITNMILEHIYKIAGLTIDGIGAVKGTPFFPLMK